MHPIRKNFDIPAGKRLGIGTQCLTQPRRGLGDGRIDRPQLGDDPPADAVARVGNILIGRVDDIIKRPLAAEALDLRPFAGKQRADDPSVRAKRANGGDAAQPVGTRTAREAQEHGLKLVVGMVGGSKQGNVIFRHHLFKKFVAHPPCDLLHAPAARFADGGDVGVEHRDGDLPPSCQVDTEIAVANGFLSADAVVDMGDAKGRTVPGGVIAEHGKQRHRVDAARKRHENGGIGGKPRKRMGWAKGC